MAYYHDLALARNKKNHSATLSLLPPPQDLEENQKQKARTLGLG